MRLSRIFQVSLASKCQILFGIAVIIIITTALVVPWVYMGFLVEELNVNQAKQAALTVQSTYHPQTQDWAFVQANLNADWPTLSRELGLTETTPRLIYVGGCDAETIPTQVDPFEQEAIEQLCRHPTRNEAQKTEYLIGRGGLTHYAMAIRDSDLRDPRSNLLGIISVRLVSSLELYNLYQIVMIGAALVAGMLAIVVFYLITQYLILSPVRDLKGVAQRIVSGEISLRSHIQTGDEFEELGEAFNEMLAHLNASQEELRKMNKSLDIKLGELAETNVSLFEANRLKSEFLANVSHELRTPLTSIIGFAELLRDAGNAPEQADPGKIRRFCNNILVSGRMLLDIINDLLDLAKIEAGKMELHRTKFPLADICEAVIDFTRPLVDKKKLLVTLQLPEPPPVMQSDAGKIQQIFYNLISNAIKFTPPEGHIDVTVEMDDPDTVCLHVKDTGPGIAEEKIEQIFEKFHQLDSSVTREYGGTGLGLAISRDLAAMLGGTISVNSKPDQGAEFIVRLPLQAPSRSETILRPRLT